MHSPVHIAITRRVRKDATAAFEQLLSEFAGHSMADPDARGVSLIYPAPDSPQPEYGILRSFSSEEARDAFYASSLYQDWLVRIAPLVEGDPEYRRLEGLEAWFREPNGKMPPRWKMAVLTWIAVWPVSMAVPALLSPIYPDSVPDWIRAGVGAAGIVLVLTWAAMPLLVKLAHSWLRPKSQSHSTP